MMCDRDEAQKGDNQRKRTQYATRPTHPRGFTCRIFITNFSVQIYGKRDESTASKKIPQIY
jgi:hypothetical protein